jgi:predicted metal-dependent hydrolase
MPEPAAAPPEPVLAADEGAAFARGVAEFNDGLFFECHDTLEDMWTGIRGPSRDFFQGLIQVSVGFYHLGNGNLVGATSMWERSLKRLSRYPGRYFGFDLQGHRREIQGWIARAQAGAVEGLSLSDLPKWRFDTASPEVP